MHANDSKRCPRPPVDCIFLLLNSIFCLAAERPSESVRTVQSVNIYEVYVYFFVKGICCRGGHANLHLSLTWALCYVLLCSVCRPSIVPSSIVPSFDSCGAPQPNAIARIVSLDSTKKIIIVAKRHIKPGEEVGGTNQRQPINAVRFSVDARRG